MTTVNIDEKGRNYFVKDVELRYVRLDKPFVGKFGTQYEMAIVVPAGREEEFKANNLGNFKTDKDGATIVNLKRGEKQPAPRVINGQKVDLTEAEVKAIGNGSKGTVKLRQWKHDFNGGGIANMIDAVQITDYVEYVGGDDGFDMVEPAAPVAATPTAAPEELF